MHIHRRHFLRNGALLAAGSSILSGWRVLAASGTATRSVAVPLSSDDKTVLAWVAGYAASYRLQGGCVLGKLKSSPNKFAQIVASATDPLKFAGLLAENSPVKDGLANGDNYVFGSGGTTFTLQNSFAGLPAVTNPDWKHQAIQYDPKSGTLTDPLGATGAGAQIDYTLKLVTKSRTLAQNFSALVTGLVESTLYGLTQDSTFNTFRNEVLGSSAATAGAGAAAAINTILVQNLGALAQVFPGNSFGAILGSPLLASSIPVQFKLSAAQVLAKFTALRPKIKQSYPDEALWFAILLPAQISPQSGDLLTALTPSVNTGFNAMISLDALTAMRQLVNDPTFTSL